MLPLFAKPIAEARERGERPDGVVFVAIDRTLATHQAHPENWRVVVGSTPVPRLEWDWCIGLDIEVATLARSDERAIAVCEAIAAARPRNLVLWETRSGKRWWLVDPAGAWPTPYLLHESDRSLQPEALRAVGA
jgi:hypothetical protein